MPPQRAKGRCTRRRCRSRLGRACRRRRPGSRRLSRCLGCRYGRRRATQRLVLLSQQPPPLQTLPSQQTLPASPQGAAGVAVAGQAGRGAEVVGAGAAGWVARAAALAIAAAGVAAGAARAVGAGANPDRHRPWWCRCRSRRCSSFRWWRRPSSGSRDRRLRHSPQRCRQRRPCRLRRGCSDRWRRRIANAAAAAVAGVLPGSKAWPGAPQTAQAPVEQAPPLAQVEPEATQVLLPVRSSRPNRRCC